MVGCVELCPSSRGHEALHATLWRNAVCSVMLGESEGERNRGREGGRSVEWSGLHGSPQCAKALRWDSPQGGQLGVSTGSSGSCYNSGLEGRNRLAYPPHSSLTQDRINRERDR